VACVLILLGTLTSWGRRQVKALSSLAVLIVAASIAVMVRFLGGFDSPYYAGICLVILASGFLFTWRATQSLLTVSAMVAFYEVPSIALDPLADNPAVFASNSFFLCSTAGVVIIGQYFNYRLKFREFRNAQLVLEAKQQIEEAHEKLKELDRFKSQFFANVTHELKTPLAMILSPLDLLLQEELGGLTETQEATLRSMMQSALKLLRQIGDLLDLSRLEDSRLTLEIAEHDLAAYVRGLVAQVQPLARRKHIELHLECEPEALAVWCDIERFERVLLNLISNAMKFTPEGGEVTVAVRDRGTEAEIEVADNGPGFPPQLSRRVFERFYQVDMEGTRRHGGAGIGLALVKEIVELHGGAVRARSAPGEGATFTVVMPREGAEERTGVRRLDSAVGRVGDEEDQATLDWSRAMEEREEYRFLDVTEATDRRVVERDPDEQHRRYTVLVVEDTADVTRVIHLTLRMHFRVVAAPDGLKGFDLAVSEQPNLIITDLMMPGIDGLELTRRLRADERTRHVPIIMLTARGDMEDRVQGLEAGVNAYLAKPFVPKELLTTVRSLLDIQEIAADILLDQRVQSLQAITGGLAHEINNPLNYIKNSLGVVRGDIEKVAAIYRGAAGRSLEPAEEHKLARIAERVERMFKTAEAGVARIGGTVDAMARYSRDGFDSGKRPYDLYEAAKEVIRLVLPATGREVKVETSFEGDGHVACVPEQINQVLSNLVQNAVEAAPEERGLVRVRGWNEDGSLCLAVEDNGPGIPVEVRDKIFTPFFTTKGPGAGMGLGLTICWRVVRSLGGTIDVEGEAGTRFLVRLPRASGG
jgi:signal transduction histidine kinase